MHHNDEEFNKKLMVEIRAYHSRIEDLFEKYGNTPLTHLLEDFADKILELRNDLPT